jgi:hypothetical protein
MAGEGSNGSYADALRAKMAHAPTIPPKVAEVERAQAKMAEAIEPELVATVTNLGKFEKFHPTRAVPREELPQGFERSCTGFLLCNEVLEVQVNQETVKRDSDYLQKHAIVAYFVGGQQSPAALAQWAGGLQRQVGDWVGISHSLGRGFFQVLSRQLAVPQKILMLTPYKSRWGTCIFQTWMPGFNATKPVGLKVPTWVTLKDVPGEFLNVAAEMASKLGELLGSDKRNVFTTDQRFCVGLVLGSGYKMKIGVTNESSGKKEEILVDYCNLPIRCCYCLSMAYLMKDYPGLVGRVEEDPPPLERSTSSPQQSSDGTNGTNSNLPPAPPLQPGDNPTIQIDEEDDHMMETNEAAPGATEQNAQGAKAGAQGGAGRGNHTQSITSQPSPAPNGSRERSSDDYRSTPEFEWNGWEKVYRGKRVRGPPILKEQRKVTEQPVGGPSTQLSIPARPAMGIRAPERPSQPSPSGIRVPATVPSPGRAEKRVSAPPCGYRASMDWSAQ